MESNRIFRLILVYFLKGYPECWINHSMTYYQSTPNSWSLNICSARGWRKCQLKEHLSLTPRLIPKLRGGRVPFARYCCYCHAIVQWHRHRNNPSPNEASVMQMEAILCEWQIVFLKWGWARDGNEKWRGGKEEESQSSLKWFNLSDEGLTLISLPFNNGFWSLQGSSGEENSTTACEFQETTSW